MVRAAILDDYQNVALAFADWSRVAKDVEIKVFDKPFASQDEAIKALQGFAIIVGMGIENVGGDIDKVTGKRCTFAYFPWNWDRGDGCIVRLVAIVDPTGKYRIERGRKF